MNMKLRIAIAAVAATALGVSACGGADESVDPAGTTPAVSETTVAAPVEETTPATQDEAPATSEETEPPAGEETTETTAAAAPVSGELPWDEGPIDVNEFFSLYVPAQQGITTMKTTTSSSLAPEEVSVTSVDQSDPNNLRAYSVSESGGVKVESVVDGSMSHTRINGGEWDSIELNLPGTDSSPAAPGAEAPVGGVQAPIIDPDANPADSATAITLVSKAERKFDVELASLPGAPAEFAITSATWWLDEQMRLAKTEIVMMDITTTTVYSDYGQPVDFPEIP